MDCFRKLAYLHEQLGDELFNALISSDNTCKVKGFCDELLKGVMSTEITVGDRTYEILNFLRDDEDCVVGHTMVERAVEMGANLGDDDGQYLLDYQEDISVPIALRNKIYFVFTEWHPPGDSARVYCIYWDVGRWVLLWRWLAHDWDGRARLLRRK